MKFSAYVVFTLAGGSPSSTRRLRIGSGIRMAGSLPMEGLDFAGGLVVHASSGVICARASLGDWQAQEGSTPPHDLPMVLLGAGLLWFGWFRLQRGQCPDVRRRRLGRARAGQHPCGGRRRDALLDAVEFGKHGKPTALGAASGLVAGLVVITPCAGVASGR